MAKSPPEFVQWFKDQADERGWKSLREIARNLDLSHPTVSDILDGEQPSFETCMKIADAFAVSSDYVVYAAGLLTKPRGWDAKQSEMNARFSRLSDDDQEDLLQLAITKLARRKKQEENNGKKTKPVSP